MEIEAEAAVAVVRTVGESPALLILRRALNPEDPWSGHFSLPGGRRDPGDADLLATCIRETWEECGLQLSASSLVQPLPVLTAGPSSGRSSRVAPFLFELNVRPALVLETREISEFHWVGLDYLMNPKNHGEAVMLPERTPDLFPGLRLGNGYVWGFTYKVLGQLFGF